MTLITNYCTMRKEVQMVVCFFIYLLLCHCMLNGFSVGYLSVNN